MYISFPCIYIYPLPLYVYLLTLYTYIHIRTPRSRLFRGPDAAAADLLLPAAAADADPAVRLAAVRGLGSGLCPVGHGPAVRALLRCLG
jgi:hypothetical protein